MWWKIVNILIQKGEELLWNDFESKILDQALRTVESYMAQFPEVKVKKDKDSY